MGLIRGSGIEGERGPKAGDMWPIPRGVVSEAGEDIKDEDADMMGDSAFLDSPNGWDL
jgi:hypothetical protein